MHQTLIDLSMGVGCLLLFTSNSAMAATVDQLVAEMSQRIEIITVSEKSNQVIPRFNQAKSLGCFEAEFEVKDNLSTELKQGVFATPKTYSAQLRFANASTQDDSKKDLRGLSIKLRGVKGKSLWGEDGQQDFILNSYPALFVATPEEFLEFIEARQKGKEMSFFINPFNPHFKSAWILFQARKEHNSPFDIRYWSTTASKLGENGAEVKYSMIPCSQYQTTATVEPGKNQLRAAMKAHLNETPGCFEFAIQLRTQPDSMPIEDASEVWDEAESAFQTVARVTFKQQNFDTESALANCEKLSFNPWQSLSEHEPLGKMNEVRREIYSKASLLRNSEGP
ncbi:MAG: catalase [Motiliproteus sp.]